MTRGPRPGARPPGVRPPALDDPGISTAGLVGLQSVVASLTGRDDFARNDIETGPVLTGIEDLASVEPNTTVAGTPLSLLLRFGPGSYDVVVELAAVAEPAVAASASRDTLTVVPESGITVDVVLVAPEGLAGTTRHRRCDRRPDRRRLGRRRRGRRPAH